MKNSEIDPLKKQKKGLVFHQCVVNEAFYRARARGQETSFVTVGENLVLSLEIFFISVSGANVQLQPQCRILGMNMIPIFGSMWPGE